MKHYNLEAALAYELPEGAESTRVSTEIDEAVEHLEDKLGLLDVTAVLDRLNNTIVFSFLMLVGDTESTESALQRALGDLRTALHASGGATPSWPEPGDLPMRSINFTPATVLDELTV